MTSYRVFVSNAKESGFILLAVIWFVAIAGLAMAYLAQKVENNLDQAFAQRKILQELIDQHNTEQTLFYLLSSYFVALS